MEKSFGEKKFRRKFSLFMGNFAIFSRSCGIFFLTKFRKVLSKNAIVRLETLIYKGSKPTRSVEKCYKASWNFKNNFLNFKNSNTVAIGTRFGKTSLLKIELINKESWWLNFMGFQIRSVRFGKILKTPTYT